MAQQFEVNEFQDYLDQCTRIVEETKAQDCPINFGDVARIYIIPAPYATSENPFSAATAALQLTALGTIANWQGSFDTPVTPQAKAYISPTLPYEIKAQDNPLVLPTVTNYPNGQPISTSKGVYETITFNLYNLSQQNEKALTSVTNRPAGVLFIKNTGRVIGKDNTGSTSVNDTFFFYAPIVLVSTRQKVQGLNAEGDLIQVQMQFEYGELIDWKEYDVAQAFSLTVLPTP